MCFVRWILIALHQDIIKLPTCAMDTCLMDLIALQSVTTIYALDLPSSITFSRFQQEFSFTTEGSDDSEWATRGEWAQHLREELMVVLRVVLCVMCCRF